MTRIHQKWMTDGPPPAGGRGVTPAISRNADSVQRATPVASATRMADQSLLRTGRLCDDVLLFAPPVMRSRCVLEVDCSRLIVALSRNAMLESRDPAAGPGGLQKWLLGTVGR